MHNVIQLFTSANKSVLFVLISTFLIHADLLAISKNKATVVSEIKQPPVADNYDFNIQQIPKSNQSIVLNGSYPTVGVALGQLTGKNYLVEEDTPVGLNGATKTCTVVITSTITALGNVTDSEPEMLYNGEPIQSHPVSKNGGYVIKNYDADLLEIRVNGTEYMGVKFEYAWIDDSNIQGNPAVYQVTWQNETPLPVKLADFQLNKEANKVHIAWSTSEEMNANRFEVQHSSDAKTWITLHSIPAVGNSKNVEQYKSTDTNPVEGKNYYRLKMIDFDETYTFSRIKDIELDEFVLKSFIYPNPVANEIFFENLGKNSISHISVYSKNGEQLLRTDKPEMADLKSKGINIRALNSGMYFVNVQFQTGQQFTEKILISR